MLAILDPIRRAVGRSGAALRGSLLASLVLSLGVPLRAADSIPRTDHIILRARMLKLASDTPVRIHWRYGGEGLGGEVIRGEITAVTPKPPQPKLGAMGEADEAAGLTLEEDAGKPTDRIILSGDTYDHHYMRLNAWSPWQPLASVYKARNNVFVTFTLEGHEEDADLTGGVMEMQFAYQGQVVKTLTLSGPDGPTFTVRLPNRSLGAKGEPSAAFTADLLGLRDYVQRKVAHLQAQPGIARPTPALYGIITDCAGYRPGAGYGIRTTDPDTMWAEFEVLRLMGFNSIRSAPQLVMDQIAANTGIGASFRRIHETHTSGYPIPLIDVGDGRKPFRDPGDGCPYDPLNQDYIQQRVTAAAKEAFELGQHLGVDSVWALTVDEIGSVFDRANEGKAHMGSCVFCRHAFREMIKADGRSPADFGATSWEPIRATYGYWSYDYWTSLQMLHTEVASAEHAMRGAAAAEAAEEVDALGDALAAGAGTVAAGSEGLQLDAGTTETASQDSTQRVAAAKVALEALEWKSRVLEVPEAARVDGVSETGWALLQYYSRRFNAESSAWLFKALQEEFDRYNAARRDAIARGEADSPAATQPWIYSFALRGNTFLMGGHSLGFFDFYKYADNAMVYETSNRDPRVWQWDAYLCDVGRSLERNRGKAFGIVVKPHRGAGTERALAALSRGVRMIYWYTYGPEWKKGDTWGGNLDILAEVAQANRIIAGGEAVTYDSDWAFPAEVAVVRPRTDEFLGDAASWENGKWVYTALQHAHVPVDALDEDLLLELDLSAYKVIVVSGTHIRQRVAAKLKDYVAAGGTLYTCGAGMARDEADQPLTTLYEVFGVSRRDDPQLWGSVVKYGATRLAPITRNGPVPEGATATAGAGTPLLGSVSPVTGRELLQPLDAAEIMATWGDGSAAAIRHAYGKGQAWLIGSYAGLEYASDVMGEAARLHAYQPDKRSWVAGPILAAGVRPVVDAQDAPLVEGVLLRNRVSAQEAAVLINWGPKHEAPVTVHIRAAATTATSAATGAALSVSPLADGWIAVTLPSLAEGDIVVLQK